MTSHYLMGNRDFFLGDEDVLELVKMAAEHCEWYALLNG